MEPHTETLGFEGRRALGFISQRGKNLPGHRSLRTVGTTLQTDGIRPPAASNTYAIRMEASPGPPNSIFFDCHGASHIATFSLDQPLKFLRRHRARVLWTTFLSTIPMVAFVDNAPVGWTAIVLLGLGLSAVISGNFQRSHIHPSIRQKLLAVVAIVVTAGIPVFAWSMSRQATAPWLLMAPAMAGIIGVTPAPWPRPGWVARKVHQELSFSSRVFRSDARASKRWRRHNKNSVAVTAALLPTLILSAITSRNVDWAPDVVTNLDFTKPILGTSLSVAGGVQVLALAIIVFAVQAYRDTDEAQFGGTFSEFARRLRLPLYVGYGSATILVNGWTYLVADTESESPWAVTVAIIATATYVAVTPLLFALLLHRSTSRPFLSSLRVARVQGAAVAHGVEAVVEHRAGRAANDHLPENDPYARPPDGSRATELVARRTGRVSDVNVARVARHAKRGFASIRVAIGSEVRKGVTVASLKKSRSFFKLPALVKVEEEHATLLFLETFDDLVAEALTSLRSSRPSWWETTTSLILDLLTAPFERSTAYGLSSDHATGSRPMAFEQPWLTRVLHPLHSLLRESRRSKDPRQGEHIPLHLARSAVHLDSPALFGLAIDLINNHQSVPSESTSTPGHLQAWLGLPLMATIEALENRILAMKEEDSYAGMFEMLERAEDATESVLLRCISTKDGASFNQLLAHWNQSLSLWTGMDHESSGESESSHDLTERALIRRQQTLLLTGAFILKTTGNLTQLESIAKLIDDEKFCAAVDQSHNPQVIPNAASWFWVSQPGGRILTDQFRHWINRAVFSMLEIREMKLGVPPVARDWEQVGNGTLETLLRNAPSSTSPQLTMALNDALRTTELRDIKAQQALQVSPEARRALERGIATAWDKANHDVLFVTGQHVSHTSSAKLSPEVWKEVLPKSGLQSHDPLAYQSLSVQISENLSLRELKLVIKTFEQHCTAVIGPPDPTVAIKRALSNMSSAGLTPTLVITGSLFPPSLLDQINVDTIDLASSRGSHLRFRGLMGGLPVYSTRAASSGTFYLADTSRAISKMPHAGSLLPLGLSIDPVMTLPPVVATTGDVTLTITLRIGIELLDKDAVRIVKATPTT